MRRLLSITIMIASLSPVCAYAQNLDDLPLYQGDNSQFGEIRIWGNETMMNVLRLWELGIREHQRGLRFVDTLPSGAAAIGPLYTGVADLGLMGHHSWPVETEGFYQVLGYEPLEIIVATGAYDVAGKMPPNVIYAGEWADKPIHLYAYDLSANSFCFSVQRLAFDGGDKWNPSLREFALNEVGLLYAAGPRPRQGCDLIMDALAEDPYGIAYTAIQCGRRNPAAKPLALAAGDGGPYIEPTKENFQNRTYPLVESIYVYINRPPGKPVEPKLKEFLRYILSRQGQKDVAQDGGYLPLTASVVREQLKKLE